MIRFNEPPYTGNEINYMRDAIERYHTINGDGVFTQKCTKWLERRFLSNKILLTTSGTTALDMAAILCEIKPGDEVILSSFTFSSTATAFVLCGARLVFVDIRPDTMNIDESKIEMAISNKTKAVIVTHYAGVGCEMDTIMEIARKYELLVVEDAAHAPLAMYKGKQLGTIGDLGCFSFHETKNFSMGEGGAISINSKEFEERAEIIREKGTNRSAFFRGLVDKYTWVDVGDSYLPSDILAAYLWAQLEVADTINADRLRTWDLYMSGLKVLENSGRIRLPIIPSGCIHNAHMFYLICSSLEERTEFISFMRDKGVSCAFHYVPLHSAPAGKKYGVFYGEDKYTTEMSDRLVRLPMYYKMKDKDVCYIIERISDFYNVN